MKLNISVLLIFLSAFCFAQTLPEVNLFIEKELKSDKVAALAIAVIDSGKVVHLSANGFRDLENELKATMEIFIVSNRIRQLAAMA